VLLVLELARARAKISFLLKKSPTQTEGEWVGRFKIFIRAEKKIHVFWTCGM
jgi:hypothetical protein